MDHTDVFKRACLIQLSTPTWNGSKGLEQTIMEKIGDNTDWLRGRKFLINPELLGPVKTTVHQARNMVQRHSLPFPVNGLYLVPKESLSLIDERLEEFRERFWIRVSEFEEQYENARREAKAALGSLYNDADYPMDISHKFRFDWRFLEIGTPGKSTILSPEIYEREKQKFVSLMDETRELAMAALREEFGEIVHDLTDRLAGNGKPRTIKSSMFNKLKEFLDDFSTKNIFEDETLMQIVEQAKSAIGGGVSAYGLKYNERMQTQLRDEMGNLKIAIDSAIEDLPRRKIRMAV